MSNAQSRAPVVVVLGHVDHGKTTLLDSIRKSNQAEKEFGGITQTIGAYEVTLTVKGYEINKITFIDTPGHEAFTKLRLRGADVADIAVLIVDAVDSVMPQTIESIFHIKSAKIPFIVAINKVDLPGANPDKVKKDLMKEGVFIEGSGGDTPVVEISAKKGIGVQDLLETILFISSMGKLTYSPDNPFKAFILESKKDKSGVVASVIVKDGVISVGDVIYSPTQQAKVKALITDRGESVKKVSPSTPCIILGFKELPEVGALISSEPVSQMEAPVKEEKALLGPEEFFNQDTKKKLMIMVKTGDTGSLEAILASLGKNESIEIVLAAVGEINKSDIFLAKITKAIIIGFSMNTAKSVQDIADQEKVIIKSYSLIYELLDELKEVSELISEREEKEKNVKGEAKILAKFIIEKEKIAGIEVIKGKININDQIELYRNSKLIEKAKVVSLKTRAKHIKELKKKQRGRGAVLSRT